MASGRFSVFDPLPDTAELLRLSQIAKLRVIEKSELRDRIFLLERACEIARVAALRNVMGRDRYVKPGRAADRNCGFARLFAALRRARSELKRRDKEASAKPISLMIEGARMRAPRHWNTRKALSKS